MIGRLFGKITHIDINCIEIDTSGIGWEVFLPKNDLKKIILGEKIEVFVFQHISDTENSLFAGS